MPILPKSLRRPVVFVPVICAVAGLLWLWRAAAPKAAPNLLVITLDTTRADRLGSYGYSRAVTPVLDSLAAGGVLCDEAHTVMPLTLPAHTSLFTGLLPPEHGVQMNGRERLDDSIETLAEVLKGSHYDTAAFVASFVLDRKFGLNQGFDVYGDDYAANQPVSDSQQRERDGANVVDTAMQWLSRPHQAPFFCWVHLYDPHAPYDAHPNLFGSQFDGRPYDAELTYVDLQVGRLIEFLKQAGLRDDTLVVVVGDHGEGFGDHAERMHGSTLYREVLRVPLIFNGARVKPRGARVASRVSLADVSPTILDLLGKPDSREITGRSFREAFEGGEFPDSPCYAATDVPFYTNGWSPLQTVTDSGWKYIRTARPELYDLASDRDERTNLAEKEPERLRQLERMLSDLEQGLVPRAKAAVTLSLSEQRTLASLGYVGSKPTTTPAKPLGNLRDIKDMLKYDNLVDDAGEMTVNGNAAGAVPILQTVLHEVPEHGKAAWTLASIHMQQRDYAAATDVFLKLLDAKPQAGGAHVGLGEALFAQGKYADAIREYELELKLDPDVAYVEERLGTALARSGEKNEALRHFDLSLAIDHTFSPAYRGRAETLLADGRLDDAKADLRKAVRYGPYDAEAQFALGMLLMNRGDSEAVGHLAKAVQLDSKNADYRIALGKLMLKRQRFAEAESQFVEARRLQPDSPEIDGLIREARERIR